MTEQLSPYAETIFKRTYAFTDNETWEGCAARVSKFVSNGDDELEKLCPIRYELYDGILHLGSSPRH